MLNNEWVEIYYVRKLKKGASLEDLKKQIEAKRRLEEEEFWGRVKSRYQRLNSALTDSSCAE